jgi:hypothetical protein
MSTEAHIKCAVNDRSDVVLEFGAPAPQIPPGALLLFRLFAFVIGSDRQ